jgi:hypothetical protein
MVHLTFAPVLVVYKEKTRFKKAKMKKMLPVPIILALLPLAAGTPYHTQGAAGGGAGALFDHHNPWRGGGKK